MLLLSGVVLSAASASATSPTAKVVQLLDSLAAKVSHEGEVENKQYEDLVRWCEENAKEKQHELKNSAQRREQLEATLEKTEADMSNEDAHISELSSSIAQNEEELEQAKNIRTAEHKDFVARDTELMETIDTLEKAIQVIKKAASKSLVQVDATALKNLSDTVTVLLDGPMVQARGTKQLQAFIQSREAAKEDEGLTIEQGEQSGGLQAVMDTLEDLLEKAEGQRADAGRAETEAQFKFDMLKQSLTDELHNDNKHLEKARKKLAGYKETQASVEGDLEETKKDAESDSETLSQIQTDCMQKAADHEASVDSRADELKALSKAKSVIEEMTGGASQRSYGLLQLESSLRHSDPVAKVLSQLRTLSDQHKDMTLALLLSQVHAAASSGDDVFAKVKGLIRDMLAKLKEKAEAEAKEHEWCTQETKATVAKKEDHESTLASLSSKGDKLESVIAKATANIATIEAELGELDQMQGAMDKQRTEEHAEYVNAQADYEQGVEGVQMAIKVLKEYYGKDSSLLQQPVVGTHSASDGAASGIIGLLEVAESDFSKMLAEVESDEKEAVEVYERQTKENKVAKTEKETSLKYTKKELARAEKSLAEVQDDHTAEEEQLDGVLEYLAKVNKRCIAKPESYEDRKAKREAEVAGLKNALEILENETVGSFLAVRSVARHT
mmetsp:Transcript_12828/g.30721  ORF Transcript_12828/g.30721 Transcript_12828/m.30721 type:complete len:672 (-) Transcript_12828:76-2091(-)